MKFNRLSLFAALLLSATLVVSGCGKSSDDDFGDDEEGDENGGAVAQAPAIDPATAATVNGTVVFEGTAPAPVPTKMDADPVCAANSGEEKAEFAQEVVVTDGKLANVFVYVSKGMEGKSFPAPAEDALLDQKGCRYHPHVIGAMVGQKVKFQNSDPTLHNIHAKPTKNKEFNLAQPNQGMSSEKVFDQEEIMIPVKCDVHGWMQTYIGVLPHPFFGVSGTDGSFSLKGLPPGTYTLTAWHEKYGTKTQDVTLGASEAKPVTFTFAAQ